MSFDWQHFLDQHGIDHVLEGREARCQCPWCGGEHRRPPLSINLDGRGFYCWQDSTHRGRSAARLVAAMRRISIEEARAITGERWHMPEQDIAMQVSALLQPSRPPEASESSEMELPSEFRPFDGSYAARPFRQYLERRGFLADEILRMTPDFGVYYARSGRQQYRVVFAIRTHNRLVAWSGRTIGNGEPRYLTEGDISSHVLWFDELMTYGGDRLVLCEGPFDALKVRCLGTAATCFFTARPSQAQISLLARLFPRYRRRVLLLDRGAQHTSLSVQSALVGHDVEVVSLPPRVKDPGEIRSPAMLDAILNLCY